MSTNTVYVVTGTNRGIGLGLVKALLAEPWHTVVATCREPAVAGLKSELATGSTGEGSTFIILTLDSATLSSQAELRAHFNSVTSLRHVDVLIANAGIATSMGSALETTAQDLETHFAVNTTAPLLTFQALWPLMQASRMPKFFTISSSVGSISLSELTGGAYGPSKAALNWLTRRLHIECEKEGLVSVAVHPGWVQTDNGDYAAKAWGYPGRPPLTVEQSIKGVLEVVNNATRNTTSGKFVSYDGQILPW